MLNTDFVVFYQVSLDRSIQELYKKIMYSLLYLNFMGFKLKRDCKIYANKITCNLYIASFYIRSEQKVLFLSPFTCVPPLLYHHYCIDEVVWNITS